MGKDVKIGENWFQMSKLQQNNYEIAENGTEITKISILMAKKRK